MLTSTSIGQFANGFTSSLSQAAQSFRGLASGQQKQMDASQVPRGIQEWRFRTAALSSPSRLACPRLLLWTRADWEQQRLHHTTMTDAHPTSGLVALVDVVFAIVGFSYGVQVLQPLPMTYLSEITFPFDVWAAVYLGSLVSSRTAHVSACGLVSSASSSPHRSCSCSSTRSTGSLTCSLAHRGMIARRSHARLQPSPPATLSSK
jgi:hypothetical protein